MEVIMAVEDVAEVEEASEEVIRKVDQITHGLMGNYHILMGDN